MHARGACALPRALPGVPGRPPQLCSCRVLASCLRHACRMHAAACSAMCVECALHVLGRASSSLQGAGGAPKLLDACLAWMYGCVQASRRWPRRIQPATQPRAPRVRVHAHVPHLLAGLCRSHAIAAGLKLGDRPIVQLQMHCNAMGCSLVASRLFKVPPPQG